MKKHYHALCKAFPEDHCVTLVRVNDVISLKPCDIDFITNHSTSMAANKAILDILISRKASCKGLIDLCSMMEAIIADGQKIVEVVEPLRNG